MNCTLCGYNLDVHKTHDKLITYCQQCGNETEEERISRPDRWTDEQKQLRVIQGGGKPKAISHLIPLPGKKKKKKRRG